MRILKSLAVLFGASAAVAGPLDDAAQKAQLERLVQAVLPFAEQMLSRHGEYFPFGATMSSDGKITHAAGYTGDEQPKSVEVISLLKAAFTSQAASNTIIASALVYDVRAIRPGTTAKIDAIAIDLDHRDGMSITILVPYSIGADKRVTLDEAFAEKGSGTVFPRPAGG